MADRNDAHSRDAQGKSPSATRRHFLQGLAGAGAAISLSSRIANAQQGEIGYWAKDLTDAQLTNIETIEGQGLTDRNQTVQSPPADPSHQLLQLRPPKAEVDQGLILPLDQVGQIRQLIDPPLDEESDPAMGPARRSE